MSPWQRFGLAMAGAVFVVLLLVAATLQPDQRGMGTHQQLGLPPCSFKTIFQVRCPSCGMTTSWAYFVRGDWLCALKTNAGGFVMAGIGSFAAPWMLGSACRGRWLVLRPSERIVLGIGLATLAITVIDWFIRILPGAGS